MKLAAIKRAVQAIEDLKNGRTDLNFASLVKMKYCHWENPSIYSPPRSPVMWYITPGEYLAGLLSYWNGGASPPLGAQLVCRIPYSNAHGAIHGNSYWLQADDSHSGVFLYLPFIALLMLY